jgi:hypothetical protein
MQYRRVRGLFTCTLLAYIRPKEVAFTLLPCFSRRTDSHTGSQGVASLTRPIHTHGKKPPYSAGVDITCREQPSPGQSHWNWVETILQVSGLGVGGRAGGGRRILLLVEMGG